MDTFIMAYLKLTSVVADKIESKEKLLAAVSKAGFRKK